MEENVALDSNKQKQFVKSIKGIKNLLKKNQNAPKPPAAAKTKGITKEKKQKFKERGLVYLSHIPHGFYENEMTQYFKQFGQVTNVRVIRSKRTGNSRGCAFVEFSEPAVAQIVADTMNNYLMGKRLIKAALVPPEKQRRHAKRKHWNQQSNPGTESRIKLKKIFNAKKTDEEDLRRARQILKNLDKTKKRLKEMDIDYDFFTPVDVPEELQKENDVKPESGDTKSKTVDVVKKEKPKKAEGKASNVAKEIPLKASKASNKPATKGKKSDDSKTVEKAGKKKQKIKDAGMKLPENFMKIAQNQSQSQDESDDDSIEFDSDEFEKAQEFDEEFSSDAEESDSEDGAESHDGSEDDEEDKISEEVTPKKGSFKPKQQQRKIKAGKDKRAALALPAVKPVKKFSHEKKRKAPENLLEKSKKQKFEKKRNPQSKQFKKK